VTGEEWVIENDPDGYPALFLADPLFETVHFGREVAEALSKVRNCLSERTEVLGGELAALPLETLDTHLDECGIFENHGQTVVPDSDLCSGEESEP
jgi:hypothetical protein